MLLGLMLGLRQLMALVVLLVAPLVLVRLSLLEGQGQNR
jgi:hypothetical protein